METTQKDLIVRRTIIIGGSLFIVLMSYGSGMRAQVKRTQDVNELRKQASQNYRDAQRKLRLRESMIEQLEARRQVAKALEALDQRNFGTAGDNVKTAVQLMQQAQVANTVIPDLQASTAALQQITPAVSTDIQAEREKLLAVASQMDHALDDFTPAFIRDSTADDTAHPIIAPTMNDVPLPPGNHIKD